MDLSYPIRSIIPVAQGAVLEILARTESPLTGRTIASLAGERVSQSQVGRALRGLVDSGLVLKREHPPAHLYVLNRDHVAAEAIEQLAGLRDTLIERMRLRIESWEIMPQAAWLFGSFARGEGGTGSDVDVLILAPDGVDGDDDRDGMSHPPHQEWTAQIDRFCDDVYRCSGNDCRVVEFSRSEFEAMLDRGDRLAMDVSRDGIHLAGEPLPKRERSRRVGTW